jgi:hypothetical protein
MTKKPTFKPMDEKRLRELEVMLEIGKHEPLPWTYGDRILTGREDHHANREFARKMVNTIPELLIEIERLRVKCGEKQAETKSEFGISRRASSNARFTPLCVIEAYSEEDARLVARELHGNIDINVHVLEKPETISTLNRGDMVVVMPFEKGNFVFPKQIPGYVCGYGLEGETALIQSYDEVHLQFVNATSTMLVYTIEVPLRKLRIFK